MPATLGALAAGLRLVCTADKAAFTPDHGSDVEENSVFLLVGSWSVGPSGTGLEEPFFAGGVTPAHNTQRQRRIYCQSQTSSSLERRCKRGERGERDGDGRDGRR